MLDTAGGSTSAPAGDAAILASPAPNIVHLACPCPGHPHEFDVVTLREHPTIPMGIAVAAVARNPTNQATMEAALSLIYLGYGIEHWTFLDRDETGGTVPVWIGEPVDRALLERWLPFASGGLIVAEAADALYSEEVFRPFRERSQTRSPVGPVASSTSATTGFGLTPPTPLRRSSRKPTAGKRSAR
jgi:hypothetical protein